MTPEVPQIIVICGETWPPGCWANYSYTYILICPKSMAGRAGQVILSYMYNEKFKTFNFLLVQFDNFLAYMVLM